MRMDSKNTLTHTIMPACYCKYVGCNGEKVDNNMKKCHERFDTSQSYHDLVEVCHHTKLQPEYLTD